MENVNVEASGLDNTFGKEITDIGSKRSDDMEATSSLTDIGSKRSDDMEATSSPLCLHLLDNAPINADDSIWNDASSWGGIDSDAMKEVRDSGETNELDLKEFKSKGLALQADAKFLAWLDHRFDLPVLPIGTTTGWKVICWARKIRKLQTALMELGWSA
ncbi:hypothetical protein M422DRAFT_46342 [Sphaerobolus stellatus SS14]|uniref:Uncharacterized protein n=1 Tax=Sphaerobolus stellatus (strain SS14) TaxID=990650 RepID=A0A0C9UT59_SPHS4|nr:hypothetical protein M422DRAFT_46342 [Sphaerobolus stellatus SS14]